MSKRVMFESHGQRLVGDLFLPRDDGAQFATIIITGAWTTVKEQMPARYAAELATRGFAALAFDFRNWGQSEGNHRQLEHPVLKTQDIVAAARHLSKRPEVDPKRIGGLGICASSGYMVGAAAQEGTIRSVALVAPWLHDKSIVEQTYGGAEGVAKLIEQARKAQETFDRTGKPEMTVAASTTDETAIMYKVPYYTEPDRGLIPEWVNQFSLASWEPWLSFDAICIAPELRSTPLEVVHSEAAAIPAGAHRFFEALAAPKTEVWLDDVTQFDFYDQDQPVAQASEAVANHFRRTLQ